jgi:mono/diheme cytochrome c family protein
MVLAVVGLYVGVGLSVGHAAGPSAPNPPTEPVPTSPAASGQRTAEGKVLFDTVGCWSCHGFNGQGAMSRGIASGPHINARVLPEAAFLHQLRSPIGVMPPYTADVLTDEQVSAIYDYLRSLPVGPGLKDIPLLNQP